MSDGALFKPERDYTKEADKILPEAEALAKVDLPISIREAQTDYRAERHPERH
jgi:26S proteasome regulatory subunit N5